MNKTLYEEALADAQKLRELAEETAKQRVIESIMPQIKSLVDSRIIGEQIDDMMDDTPDEVQAFELTEPLEEPAEDQDQGEVEGNVLNITAQGDVNIDMSSGSEEEEDDFVLTDTMAEAVRDILMGKTKYAPSVAERVATLSNTVSKLKAVHEALEGSVPKSKKRRINLAFAHCVKEAMNLRSQLILMEQGTQDGLELKLTETIKEMKTMSKSNRNIFDYLFEAEDKKKMEELEEAELSLELDDEEKEELAGAEDAEAVDTALEDILGDLEVAMGDAEVEDEPAEDLDAEEGGEEAEEEGEELDLEEMDEMDEMDEVYEIDESVLRRELRKMRRLREQEEAVDTYADHPAEEVGDVFYDVSEEDLINVLADELGPVDDGVAAEPETVTESRIARRVRNAQSRHVSP